MLWGIHATEIVPDRLGSLLYFLRQKAGVTDSRFCPLGLGETQAVWRVVVLGDGIHIHLIGTGRRRLINAKPGTLDWIWIFETGVENITDTRERISILEE